MEMVVAIDGNKVKYQGSFKSVMERLAEEGKGKELKLLSVHAGQKELRRLKRELRANDKDLYKTAKSLAKWFLTSEYRAINRKLKELKKRTDKGSIQRYNELKAELEKIEEKCKLYE
jgi:hypothetical protein